MLRQSDTGHVFEEFLNIFTINILPFQLHYVSLHSQRNKPQPFFKDRMSLIYRQLPLLHEEGERMRDTIRQNDLCTEEHGRTTETPRTVQRAGIHMAGTDFRRGIALAGRTSKVRRGTIGMTTYQFYQLNNKFNL